MLHKNLTLHPDEESYLERFKHGKKFNGMKLAAFTHTDLLSEIGDLYALGFPCADCTVDSMRHLQRGIPNQIYNNGIVGGMFIFAPSYPGFEESGVDFYIRRSLVVVDPDAYFFSIPQPHWPCRDAHKFNITLPQVMEKYIPESVVAQQRRLGPKCKIITIFHEKVRRGDKIISKSRRLLF